MTIQCKICQREFENQITNSHLKTHGITTQEYKAKFGQDSLSSLEYKKKLSESRLGENNGNFGKHHTEETKKIISNKNAGKTAWNKGLSYDASPKLLTALREREEKYKNGDLVRPINIPSEETKQKISISVTKYAVENPNELSDRAKKSIQTKKNNGYDLGFFRGKHHTEETKQLLTVKSKQASLEKSEISKSEKLQRISESNLNLLSSIDKTTLDLECNICQTKFSYTKQYFNLCKYTTERCPTCYPKVNTQRSTQEDEIFDFVKQFCPDAIQSYRSWSGKKEVDIFVPSKNIALEYNGLYWHSEPVLIQNGFAKTKDNDKRIELNQLGIRYIGIFEDEWINKPEIVKSRLKNILGITGEKIYARKTTIKEISSKEASLFCETNHIQGKGRSNVRYGLFLNDELVSVMTFSKNNVSRKIQEWEINRFCHKLDKTVVGGASKIFSKFLQDYSPETVISYADSRYSEGNLYQNLGMVKLSDTVPNYWYVPRGKAQRIHRYTLRKTKEDGQTLTERELRSNQGFSRIYDCGSSKWVWRK